MTNTTSTGLLDSKPHYHILDGLRGVAALLVVVFHLLEPHAGGDHAKLIINHGYLAVDFFFMLSGYVIGYAYDDRWDCMTIKDFLKRRIVRLHPLVIWGTLFGTLTFYLQASPTCFPLVAETPIWKLLLVMLLGFTMLPLPIPWDIRGWIEMHPLNGPAWTLYFEYIGNLLYALFFRRLGMKALALLVVAAGCMTTHYLLTCPSGDIIGGWALNLHEQYVGFMRLLFPFLCGLLLSRLGWRIPVKRGAFWLCALLLCGLLAMPRVGSPEAPWMNGLYELFVITCCFPIIVLMGASGTINGKHSTAICNFMGDISYPIYITHFPFVLMYTAWVANTSASLAEGLPYIAGAVVAAVSLAYLSFRLYDLPVRRWLTEHWLKRK